MKSEKIFNIVMENRTIEKLNINVAKKAVEQFYLESVKDQHSRYKSWEHCYKVFKDNRKCRDNEETIDYLALHLGFYLASWGMMRGSSFLLNKDYKVHTKVVEEILKTKYDDLQGRTAEDMLANNNDIINRIIELAKTVKTIYSNNGEETNNATDTLVTKILLGTLGCTPAYDRYFKESLKEYGYCQTFNEKSLTGVANFYIRNQKIFDDLLKELNAKDKGIEYTEMKLMDMCMWQMAMDKSKEGKNNDETRR